MSTLLKLFLFITIILAITFALPLNNKSQQSDDSAVPDSDDSKNCPSVIYTAHHKSGKLNSPLYPSKYPNNSNCTYILSGEASKKVKITFDEFDLEPCCDFVYLYDGIISEASKIKRLSGDKKGKSYETKLSNVMIVKFTSDANFRFKGFKAKFDSI